MIRRLTRGITSGQPFQQATEMRVMRKHHQKDIEGQIGAFFFGLISARITMQIQRDNRHGTTQSSPTGHLAIQYYTMPVWCPSDVHIGATKLDIMPFGSCLPSSIIFKVSALATSIWPITEEGNTDHGTRRCNNCELYNSVTNILCE